MRSALKNLYLRYFRGWGTDQAFRYLPIRDVLEREALAGASILEVGSGGKGITPYLRRRIVGCDLAFPEPEPELEKVTATAIRLPFREASFDVVLSVDSLEHLTAPERPVALSELVRVARRMVIVTVPSGAPAARQDQEFADYASRHGSPVSPFLEEHLANGLPDPGDIRRDLEAAARERGKRVDLTLTARDNLTMRSILIKGWHHPSSWRKQLVRRSVILAPLLYRFTSFGDCYRLLAVARLEAPPPRSPSG